MSRIVIEDLPNTESPSNEPRPEVFDRSHVTTGQQTAPSISESEKTPAAERPTNGQALDHGRAIAEMNDVAAPGRPASANGSSAASGTSRNPVLNDLAIAELFINPTSDVGPLTAPKKQVPTAAPTSHNRSRDFSSPQ